MKRLGGMALHWLDEFGMIHRQGKYRDRAEIPVNITHMTESVTSSKYDIPISVGTLRSRQKAKHATHTGMLARIT